VRCRAVDEMRCGAVRRRVEEASVAPRRGGVVVDAVVGGDDEALVVPRPLLRSTSFFTWHPFLEHR